MPSLHRHSAISTPSLAYFDIRIQQGIFNSRNDTKAIRMVYQCRAVQRTPRLDLVETGATLAIDCEGVILVDEVGWEKKGCGRVSIVNEREEVVYDTFVYYGPHVNHRPPPQRFNLGVKYNDIKPKNGALRIEQVTRDVTRIFDRAGLVVGHAISNDKEMLRDVPWERYTTRDTQQMCFEETDRKALKILAGAVLGRSIQGNGHSSIDDAQATMALYFHHEKTANRAGLYDSGVTSGSEGVCLFDDGVIFFSGTSATSSSSQREADQGLTAHRMSIPRYVAPGRLVALPDIKGIGKGKKFDPFTSTYYLGGPSMVSS